MDEAKQKPEIYGHLALLKLGQILAFDDTVNNAAKRIFSLLAGYADKNGICFPSVKKIANSLCMSRTSVIKQISILKDHGYLRKEDQFDRNRTRKANIYIFNLEMAAEHFTEPDIFSPKNVTLVVTYLATILSYSALYPSEDTGDETLGSYTKRKDEKNRKKEQSEKDCLARVKVAAASWESYTSWLLEVGISKEEDKERKRLQSELSTFMKPLEMTEFSIQIQKSTKGLPIPERLKETIRLCKEELEKRRKAA